MITKRYSASSAFHIFQLVMATGIMHEPAELMEKAITSMILQPSKLRLLSNKITSVRPEIGKFGRGQGARKI